MATARPFAYNTGATISGTIQVGDLAVGSPTSGFESTGLEWWNGPDEELGYVIAQSVPSDTQPTPVRNPYTPTQNIVTNGLVLNLDPITDGRAWWFNVPHNERELLQSIRTELGLDKPFFGMHMSIGYANEKNIDHSTYIHDLIKKDFIR